MSTGGKMDKARREAIERQVDECYRQRSRQLRDEAAAREERIRIARERDEFAARVLRKGER